VQQQQQRLLLFNLFALEGYCIAEALQVPCCVVQPYLVPYSMPAGGWYCHLAAAAAAPAAAMYSYACSWFVNDFGCGLT
jgi:hypothetical protein